MAIVMAQGCLAGPGADGTNATVADPSIDPDDPPFKFSVWPSTNRSVTVRVERGSRIVAEGRANRSQPFVALTNRTGDYSVTLRRDNRTIMVANTSVGFHELAGCNQHQLTVRHDDGDWRVDELREMAKCGDPSDIVDDTD